VKTVTQMVRPHKHMVPIVFRPKHYWNTQFLPLRIVHSSSEMSISHRSNKKCSQDRRVKKQLNVRESVARRHNRYTSSREGNRELQFKFCVGSLEGGGGPKGRERYAPITFLSM
jgi:hypothetical protein